MAKYQIVEKSGTGIDWELVRYSAYPMENFNTEEKADEAATLYLTEVNVNNALTAGSKLEAIEAFMVTDEGLLLGTLDGEKWYYPDPKNPGENIKDVTNNKGKLIEAKSHYLIDGKTEVKVRPCPGT